MSLLSLFDPWEPSLSLVVVFAAAALLFARGARRIRVSVVRQAAFWLGLALFYIALHTRLDYYAEHQFFVHRLQQSGTRVYFAGAGRSVRRTLLIAGLRKPLVRYASTAEDALAHWRSVAQTQPRTTA